MILLITNKEDIHPTPVIEYLRTLGVELFRLNTECLLTDYDFEWWNDGKTTDFYVRNKITDREIYGHDVSAVWERRPERPQLLYTHNEDIDKHNQQEVSGFLRFLLFYLSDIYSIGNHFHEYRAETKMEQLKVALEVGFDVPATCFSNRKEAIVKFAKDYEYLVLKCIDSLGVIDDDKIYDFYTQKAKSSTLAGVEAEAFTQTVSFVQNYVEKAFELRVTVVGDDVFTAKIDSQAVKSAQIDWREGFDEKLKHEEYQLPEQLEEKCRKYLRLMNLQFGCFDFIVTPEGRYVFLECNPNGQWLWIQKEVPSLKIAESIAHHLMNGGDYLTNNDERNKKKDNNTIN